MFFPHFSQLEYSDCGATCLKIILKYYKKKVSLNYLRDLCETTRVGVSMNGLQTAAQKLHFEVVSLLCTTSWLKENALLPCIIHWKQEHFVVLYKITATHFYISDPAYGKIKLKRELFENWWKEGNDKGIVLLLEPAAGFAEQVLPDIPFRAAIKRSLSYYKEATTNQRSLFMTIFGTICIGAVIVYLFPKSMQMIIDQGIEHKDFSVLWSIFLFQLVLIFSQNIFKWLQGWLSVKLNLNISLRMITQLLLKIIRLPVRFFDIKVPTDIFQRINDQKYIETFITDQLLQTFFSVTLAVFLTVRLFLYNTVVGIVFTSVSLFSIVWIFLFYKMRRQLDYTNFRLNSESQNLVNELIYGMVEIKINSAQDNKIGQWSELQKRIFSLKKKTLQLGVYQGIGVQLITQIKNIGINFLCAYWIIKGEMTLGAMLSIGYITGLLANPIESLSTFSQSVQDAQLAFARLDEIRQREDEARPGQLKPAPAQKAITMNNVSFKYEGNEQTNVINELDITFPIGKVTAIVGSSGSGKSTILKLLLNFYKPQKGKLLLDETDFASLDPDEWRKQCGIVLQDGYIFSGTISDNIAIGESHPDIDRLWNAARIACLDDYIESLPMKFNTKIGNTGAGISGGQKQRILIARAVYKNPGYLFFDEATSSLDANNEMKIMKNLSSFFNGKTVVVVAHRLSTVKNADQIIVLEKGRIAETGNHESLIREKSKYFELIKNQLELGN